MAEPATADRAPEGGLADPIVYADCVERIGRLDEKTEPRWGSMSAAQMLAHCAEVQEVANGGPLRGTPWFIRLAAPLIRRAVVGSRPYPRDLKTHPQYVQTEEREFEVEKQRLIRALDAYRATADAVGKHPLFGRMTAAEKSWSALKHLDHHLTQFGV